MLHDFIHALRQLRLNPAFAAIAICVIALGIGANTAIFSVIDAVILQPLPYEDPGRLVMLWETRPDRGLRNNVVSGANYSDWRVRAQSFTRISALVMRTASLTGAGEPEDLRTLLVGADFFPILGIGMAQGRSFTPEECRPGVPSTVILSDSLWRRKFASDPSIVGKVIRLNGNASTVIGIAPPNVLSLSERAPDLWTALGIDGRNPDGTRSSGRNFSVIARLKPGITVEQADSEIRGIARQLEQEYPQFNSNWSAKAVPLTQEIYGRVQTTLFVLLGAVAFILLIACANVANLLLIRAAGRQREMAIRASLGAGRGRLIRQMLVESVTLAGIGGVLGILLAYVLLQLLKVFGPADIRRLQQAEIDGTVLLFTASATLLTGVLLGLAPALMIARRALAAALREGGRGSSAGRRTNRVRDAFTVAQVALALMLLTGAGLLVRSFARLISVEPGFRAESVLTFGINLPRPRYGEGRDVRFFAELGQRIRALPGVVNASTITFLPFKGMGSGTGYWRADAAKPEPGQIQGTDVRMVQPLYFETMNIPVRSGRTFTEQDINPKTPLRFVVSEALAHQMFPNEDPLGKPLLVQMLREDVPGEIIGVVGNIKHGSLADTARPMVYYPQSHLSFGFGTVVVRTAVEPLSLTRAVTEAVHAMDPQVPVSEVGTMQQWVDESLSRTKFQTWMLGAFAALAMTLAVLGIYGVISYGVAQRRHEIGVRMALGAQRRDVARLILSRGLALTLTGLAIGLAAAVSLGRYLETLLYEIKPADPLTLGSVALLLLAIALLAVLLPARRASRVDPMVVLRYE